MELIVLLDQCVPLSWIKGDPCIECFKKLVFEMKACITAKDLESQERAMISAAETFQDFNTILESLEKAKAKK